MKKFRLLLILAGLAAGNGLLAYRLLPQPSPETAPSVEDSGWQLPEPPEAADLQTALQVLRQRQPWGRAASKPSETEQSEKTEPAAVTETASAEAWRFAGVVYEGGKPYMLVQKDGPELQRYEAGDSLTEGVQLLAVYPDRVKLQKDSGTEFLSLYPQTYE